jgi:hypothetical protein
VRMRQAMQGGFGDQPPGEQPWSILPSYFDVEQEGRAFMG